MNEHRVFLLTFSVNHKSYLPLLDSEKFKITIIKLTFHFEKQCLWINGDQWSIVFLFITLFLLWKKKQWTALKNCTLYNSSSTWFLNYSYSNTTSRWPLLSKIVRERVENIEEISVLLERSHKTCHYFWIGMCKWVWSNV